MSSSLAYIQGSMTVRTTQRNPAGLTENPQVHITVTAA